MCKPLGPIGALIYLLKRYPGWSLVAAGAVLVLWSSVSISISQRLREQDAMYPYRLFMQDNAIGALAVGIALVIPGAGVQFSLYRKIRRQSEPLDPELS